MPQNNYRNAFSIEVAHADSPRAVGSSVRVSVHTEATSEVCGSSFDVDLWKPQLAPLPGLFKAFRDGLCDWYEFRRRYAIQLESFADDCEQFRCLACESGIVLLHSSVDIEHNVAVAMKHHLEQLECQRRWTAGLIVGGYLYPLRDEVVRSGGLWFPQHKAWVMPNREARDHILSLLPGDF